MYRIGVDLGGTNIAVGLVNDKAQLVRKMSVPTGVERGGEAIVADMAKLSLALCEAEGITLSDVAAIGIATPGVANIETGVVEYANNLNFVKFPLAALLSEALGFENIKIANDANAAAWGEAVAGAAKGSRHNVMITLGTGVGGGVIIDNKIYTGFNSAGAELGHTVIEVDGVPCTCGRRGCWETYSSATALIRMTKEKIEECRAKGRDSLMLSVERVTGRTACDCMRQGDAAAKEVYDKYIKYLAAGLTNMVNVFQPEVISLGGGVSNEGQSLIDDLTPYIKREAYGASVLEHFPELRIAKLGNDAGIIGAALLG